MAAALRRPDVAVIAELKRASPSKGSINAGLQAGDQASAYATGGAAALSILTEPERFGGSLDDLVEARERVSIPLLRKDFIVDELQLVEARIAGAAAALLIVRGLDPERLRALHQAGTELGLTPLVEVRDEWELEQAVAVGAMIIGVNNRDLETLVIDPERAARLIPRIPAGIVAVAESGITSRVQIEAVVGADAVLVGSSISAAADPVAAVRALTGVKRHGRG
jgi:indole-3-glycerol phosphate synthase